MPLAHSPRTCHTHADQPAFTLTRLTHVDPHRYLGLSVIVDTVPKKEKKQSMETKLAELERDIALLERHSEVYVRD